MIKILEIQNGAVKWQCFNWKSMITWYLHLLIYHRWESSFIDSIKSISTDSLSVPSGPSKSFNVSVEQQCNVTLVITVLSVRISLRVHVQLRNYVLSLVDVLNDSAVRRIRYWRWASRCASKPLYICKRTFSHDRVVPIRSKRNLRTLLCAMYGKIGCNSSSISRYMCDESLIIWTLMFSRHPRYSRENFHTIDHQLFLLPINE